MIPVDAIGRLRPGDHACVVVEDDDTRARSLTAYIEEGLRHRHRILYYGDGPEEIADGLAARGVDAMRSGQLRLATAESSYLASGTFDPQATIDGWRHESAQARAGGYHGLRAIGDMSWGARPVPGADRLAWYEAQVNRVFADGYAMAICLYDRRLFGDAALRQVSWSHPATIGSGTDAHDVPLLRTVRTTDPPGISLHGEADLSNRAALRTVLQHLAEDTPTHGGPLVVDVSGLRFMDAAAVRILVRTAAAAAHRLRVTGCSPSIRRLLTANGANAVADVAGSPAT